MYFMQLLLPGEIGETARVCLKQHLQPGAQGGRRYETPLAYGDYHGRGWANPFWRSLKITTLYSVVIFLLKPGSLQGQSADKAPGREGERDSLRMRCLSREPV